jgi:hypothetical protein
VAGKPAQTKPKTQTVSALLPAANHNAHEIATDMSAAHHSALIIDISRQPVW